MASHQARAKRIAVPSALLVLTGLHLVCTPSITVFAQAVDQTVPSKSDPYGDDVAEAAQRFELPATWIRSVLRAESGGNPRATSPKGAIGLMQIMPATWDELRVRHRLGEDPYDPHDNIIAGTAYIRTLYDRFGSPGWIAAYNAGPNRYQDALKGKALPAETRAYVATVRTQIASTDDAPRVVSEQTEAASWIRAPLFVPQVNRRSDADIASVTVRSDTVTIPASSTENSTAKAQSDSIFVARAKRDPAE